MMITTTRSSMRVKPLLPFFLLRAWMSLNLKVEFMGISFGKCFLFSMNNLPTCFRKPITLGKIFFGVVGEAVSRSHF
jgi:hypothetical protein